MEPTIRTKAGRPARARERAVQVTMYMDPSLIDQIDKIKGDQSRSQFLYDAAREKIARDRAPIQ